MEIGGDCTKCAHINVCKIRGKIISVIDSERVKISVGCGEFLPKEEPKKKPGRKSNG